MQQSSEILPRISNFINFLERVFGSVHSALMIMGTTVTDIFNYSWGSSGLFSYHLYKFQCSTVLTVLCLFIIFYLHSHSYLLHYNDGVCNLSVFVLFLLWRNRTYLFFDDYDSSSIFFLFLLRMFKKCKTCI